ncbi:MAG: AAA family ATPase [bacterium]
MYTRLLRISYSYSSFLFGARGTGKTTYLQNTFNASNSYWFDLLDIDLEDRIARNPKLVLDILGTLDKNVKYIIFDEIQKLPKLLDLIHTFVQKTPNRFRFILTGSSARKLRSSSANMLAGRAFVFNLFPLSFIELNNNFKFIEYLKYGGLPQVYKFKNNSDKISFLKAYELTYLKEEVWAEHLIKNLDPFRNFLEVAAQSNGDIINYTKIASLIGVTTKTVQVYYDILKETYIGIILDAYHSSARKRLIQSPKFYFIDIGIKRALDNTLSIEYRERTYAYGKAFEHFVITQIYILNNYYKKDYKMFYLKTKDGVEIDLIIEKPTKEIILVEIKSTNKSDTINTTNLRHLKKDMKAVKAIVMSNDSIKRVAQGVEFVKWDEGIKKIFK